MTDLRSDLESDGAPARPRLSRVERDRLLTAIESSPSREPRRPGNLRAAEEMLERYIKERKKSLAELALETVLEIDPRHPRRQEYEGWVGAIDQESERRAQLEAEVERGRNALQADDWDGARRALQTLRKLAPDTTLTQGFVRELELAEQNRAEDVSIRERKARIEALLAAREVNQAEVEIDALAGTSVPKVTLDFLRKRLEEIRAELRAAAEMQSLESVFRQHLENRSWQAARDVATAVDELRLDRSRVGEMYDHVDRLEAEDRRQRSVEEGIVTLERFIDQGRRAEAELALKVLRGLDVDQQLDLYQRRIERL